MNCSVGLHVYRSWRCVCTQTATDAFLFIVNRCCTADCDHSFNKARKRSTARIPHTNTSVSSNRFSDVSYSVGMLCINPWQRSSFRSAVLHLDVFGCNEDACFIHTMARLTGLLLGALGQNVMNNLKALYKIYVDSILWPQSRFVQKATFLSAFISERKQVSLRRTALEAIIQNLFNWCASCKIRITNFCFDFLAIWTICKENSSLFTFAYWRVPRSNQN